MGGNTLDFEYPVFLKVLGGWQSGLMHQLRKLTGLTTPRVRISHRLREEMQGLQEAQAAAQLGRNLHVLPAEEIQYQEKIREGKPARERARI